MTIVYSKVILVVQTQKFRSNTSVNSQQLRGHMEKLRLHIKKQETEKETHEEIDLEEKIRRIKEKNKAIERRHREIENDKQQASSNSMPKIRGTGCHEKEKSSEKAQVEKPTIKGVQVVTGKKAPKGRGQRLLEMSKEPLKAMEFASKTRDHLNMYGSNFLPEGNQISNNTHLFVRNEIKPRKIECYANQRSSSEMKKGFQTSEIPSAGFNPLMDYRYTDKPKIRSSAKEHFKERDHGRKCDDPCKWDKVKIETKGQKRGNWERSKGHSKKEFSVLHKEVLGLSLPAVKQTVRQGGSDEKELTCGEDWSAEVMDLNESKVEPIVDMKSQISEKSPDRILGGHVCDEEKIKDSRVFEGIETKENDAKWDDGSNTEPIFDKEDSDIDDEIETLPQDNVTRKEKMLARESYTSQTVPDMPELKDKLNLQDKPLNTKYDKPEINPNESENKSKVTVKLNYNIEKTPSSSSFDEFMFMLSPLDVPSNWGDCEFDDENSEPVDYAV